MKKYLFLLFLLYSPTLFGQQHNADTSFPINKQTFKIQTREINADQITLTIYRNAKIIMVDTIESDGLSGLKFPDFDKDGNKDIMLTYMGNNFTYNLYLFDKTKNVFRFVKGFDRFPASQQLKANPKYYFSYHRAGCADMNWVSDIFYIADFKTIHIGQIYGKGCDADIKKEPQIIEIYKIIGNTEDKATLIEKLPYLKHIPNFGDKWDFIKKYWEKNYLKVVPTRTTNR
ncbi:MAG TPA: hypothetical protein VF476_06485 [Chitinophagaceae bacterium]